MRKINELRIFSLAESFGYAMSMVLEFLSRHQYESEYHTFVRSIRLCLVNRILGVCVLTSMTFGASGQDPRFDSLSVVWNNEQLDDSIRLSAYNVLFLVKRILRSEGVIDQIDKAIEFAESAKSVYWQAIFFRHRGDANRMIGNYQESIADFDKSSELFKKSGNISRVSYNIYKKGETYRAKGEYRKALEFYFRHLDLSKRNRINNGICRASERIGLMYKYFGEYDSAIYYLEEGLKSARKNGDKRRLSMILSQLGHVYDNKGDFDAALAYYEESLRLKRELDDHHLIGNELINIGNYYFVKGDFAKALDYFDESRHHYELANDQSGIAFFAFNVGKVYQELGEYDQALDLFNQCLKIRRNLKDRKGISYALNKIGNVYEVQGIMDLSLANYKESLMIREEIGYKKGVISSLLNIGSVTKSMADSLRIIESPNTAVHNYNTALQYFIRCLSVSEESEDEESIVDSKIGIAAIYETMGNYELALKFGRQAMMLGEKLGKVSQIRDGAELLHRLYKSRGDYLNALRMYEIAVEMSNKLSSENNIKQMIRQQFKFTYDQQKLSDSLAFEQQRALDVYKHESRMKQEVTTRWVLLGVLLFVVLYLLYIYRSWRTKNNLLKKIETLNDNQARWFTNIAHELRTPLTLITGPLNRFINQAQRRLSKDELEHIHLVERNSNRLIKLVNEILDISKLETGEIKVKDQVTDLALMIQNTMSLFHDEAEFKGVRLETDIAEQILLNIDAEKFNTVLTNLVSNALKYTDDGEILVTLAETTDKQWIELKVKDTGVGINKEELAHLFDRFYQAENADSQGPKSYGGSGLGLALSKELISLYDGKITADSTIGEGSTFSVYIPASLRVDSEVHVEPEIENIAESSIRLLGDDEDKLETELKNRKFNVLLAEDNLDMQNYIAKLLSPHYEITRATNGQQAFDQIKSSLNDQKESFDLIISDVMMPKMDGFELAKKIKSELTGLHIPFIFVTARADYEDQLHGLRIGVDDYVTKPFREQELLARINNLLTNALSRQEIMDTKNMDDPNQEEDNLPSYGEVILKRLVDEINNRISDPELSVDHLADCVAMHKKTLTRTLKKTNGLTPGKLIQTVRLEKALKMLEKKSYTTVREIAFATGYESPSKFSATFEKRYGKKPSELL